MFFARTRDNNVFVPKKHKILDAYIAGGLLKHQEIGELKLHKYAILTTWDSFTLYWKKIFRILIDNQIWSCLSRKSY